jgi:hypothetical protein
MKPFRGYIIKDAASPRADPMLPPGELRTQKAYSIGMIPRASLPWK